MTTILARRLSKGYTPASVEELEQPISGNALQLLLRIRRDCDLRETDGLIAPRHLDALGVAHGMSSAARRASIAELIKAGLIRQDQSGFQDVHFKQWCRSAADREDRREQWRIAKRKKESPKDSSPDSAKDSAMESKKESTPLVARAASNKAFQQEQQQQQDEPPAALEVQVPTQGDSITVIKVWEEIAGRQATLGEISHAGWLLDQYNRLTASQIDQKMRQVHQRQLERQQPISAINYFDQILRELNDASKPPRSPGVVHGMERMVPVVHGVDANGNPEPPMPDEELAS